MAKISSFKDVLDRHRGVGPGFDLLRFALALLIFYGHTGFAAGSHAHAYAVAAASGDPGTPIGGWNGWIRPILTAYVPAFFALSGFLVTGSALRTRVTSTFLAFRVLRLLPALLTEVTLSAVLLGAFLTNIPPREYFASGGFFRYFGNIIGIITFDLPGVFQSNPVHAVNVNLWTLPSEFYCYLITALLMLSGIFYSRIFATFIFVFFTSALLPLNLTTNFATTPTTLAPVAIVYYFFSGMMYYHWREFIPKSWTLFAISTVLTYVLMYSHHMVFVAPIFLTYCTLFVGMLSFPRLPLISSGDYSYGIYLYGFPITQAVVQLVPYARGNGKITFLVAIVLTGIFAALSWHYVEKPTLALKRKLPERYFPPSRQIRTNPTTRTPGEPKLHRLGEDGDILPQVHPES